MKTLQTITTCLLLFISINATAQEKQNDATWEETVEFLKKNSGSLYNNSFFGTDNYTQIEITNELLIVKDFYDNRLTILKKIGLEDIIKVELVELHRPHNGEFYGFNIHINAVGDVVERTQVKISRTEPKSILNIGIHDYYKNNKINSSTHEMRLRIVKALQHLAYLANEKRSKSKF